jgi:hypothetical protein
MGAYLFYVVCVSIWLAFGWALLERPVVLDRAWAGMQRLPLLVKPVVWVAFLPWVSGLAIWESGWRDPRARRIAVVLVAIAFIVFWTVVTFPSGSGRS